MAVYNDSTTKSKNALRSLNLVVSVVMAVTLLFRYR